MPHNREDYIDYLREIDRLDEAAQQMAIIVNDEKFVSQRDMSQHQVGYRARCRIQ
jgi:pre-mRNA-splicing factor SYF1